MVQAESVSSKENRVRTGSVCQCSRYSMHTVKDLICIR